MLRKVLLAGIFTCFLNVSFAQQAASNQVQATRVEGFTNKVLDFAEQHLHIRYRSGGTTKGGFDCSGFVRFCFKNFGMLLPHSSSSMGSLGHAVKVDDCRPGDLIFFKGSNSRSHNIGHVGIISEVKEGKIKFIHSAYNGGVRFDWLDQEKYYQNRFAGIRRVVGVLDLLPDQT